MQMSDRHNVVAPARIAVLPVSTERSVADSLDGTVVDEVDSRLTVLSATDRHGKDL